MTTQRRDDLESFVDDALVQADEFLGKTARLRAAHDWRAGDLPYVAHLNVATAQVHATLAVAHQLGYIRELLRTWPVAGL